MQTIEKFELNPKKLFLIDGIGAILSAFLLGFVLVRLEIFFGIPIPTLYFLATFPIFFAFYDFYCYRKKLDKLGQLLKGIAVLNILYCCLSLGFVLYHFETITSLGITYILLEIIIVFFLAILEIRVAKRLILNSINK